MEQLLASRQAALAGLVPALAVPRLAGQPGLATKLLKARWRAFGSQPSEHRFLQHGVEFLYVDLPWDSRFFGRPMTRLLAVLFADATPNTSLVQAVKSFEALLAASGIRHCYCEVAAADIPLLYTLGCAGWGLTEIRLHYYHDELATLTEPRRPTRAARPDEAEQVAAISATNRNPNDRFHAYPAFGPVLADAFLAEYARAAVTGFCDVVLVPEQPEIVDNFLAVSYLPAEAQELGIGLGRVVLTAVGLRNRGWHRALVAETLYRTRERGGEIVFMTTQATNGAVIRNAERLGFKLGGVTQIFSIQPTGS